MVLVFLLPVLILNFGLSAQEKSVIDSLKLLVEKSSGTGQIDYLIQLSNYLHQEKPKIAQDYAKRALELSIAENDILREAESRVCLANAYRFQRKFNEVILVLNPTLPHLNKLKNNDLIAEILNSIGIAHYQLGHDTLSLDKFYEAIGTQKSLSDAKLLSEGLKNIGNFYFQTKNHSKAIEFYYKSAQVDSLIADSLGIGQSLFGMGEVLYELKRYPIAERFFTRSVKHLKGNELEIKVYLRLAAIYEQTDSRTALDFLGKVESANQKLGNQEASSLSYFLLKGRIDAKNNAISVAFACLDSAEQLINTEIDKKEYINSLLAVANSLESNKKLIFAEKTYRKALALSTPLGLIQKKADALLGLARIARNRQNLLLENSLLQQYSLLSDSIASEIRRETNEAITQRYDYENLEKKIDAYRNDNKIQNLVIEKEKNRRLFLITLLSIVCPLLALITFLYIDRNRVNRYLAEKNHQINQQNEELNAINEQLLSSRQELVALNQTKDKFFSIIAHDLKSPLVSLKTYLSAINEPQEGINPRVAVQLAQLEDSLIKVIDLINNLLFWALSQEDSIRFNPERFNLWEALEEEVKMAQITAIQKRVHLEVEIDPDYIICTDRNMLLFIIRNLVANALKFTPTDGEIIVSLAHNSEYSRIDVSDTGIGIESERIDKLFDLVKKLSPNGRNKKEGSGLGLMLSREFAIKMGGKIEVSSSLGIGSIFSVFVPSNKIS